MDGRQKRELRRRIHRELVGSLDFDRFFEVPREEVAALLRQEASRRMASLAPPLTRFEQEHVVERVLDDMLGLGPLEDLLRDPDVTRIVVTGPGAVTVVRRGATEEVADDLGFDDREHLARVVERIVDAARGDGHLEHEPPDGLRGRMIDGSAFRATLPPIGLASPTLLIERQRAGR